ncbi:MAG: U32 family peptidase, partial [Erysipelotrichaceae bacterium]|nr:U32 family peptidase [Erysipelotrichaceae bacterium]
MPDVELLAPAGSKEALIAAVQNGANAVYLAGQLYGARAYANNFNEKEIVEAISYCHAYDVKVYVTMNTMLYTNEIEEAYQYAKFLYEHGADAILVQDFGLLWLLRTRLPDCAVHASTQMHAHNLNAVKYLKSLGVQRIVIARETPLELMKEMVRTGVEIETFVHGALCVSYSGQCYLSSVTQNRSGNRGMCAQPCRFTYDLYKDGKKMDLKDSYLLSPKDLNTLPRLKELLDTNVSSLKVEGRMKRPEYVASIIRTYREAIDAIMLGNKPEYNEEDIRKLFNRG